MKGTTLGGTAREWPHRLLRSHLPLGAATGLLLVLFMTLPSFDPQRYPQMDMRSGSALPRPMDMTPAPATHGAGATASPAPHGGSPTASPATHAGSRTPAPGHGDQASSTTHAGDQAGATSTERTNDRGRRLFDQRLTVATGYVATALLGVTLLIGPGNLLLRKRNPISSYLRRDIGMWVAGVSVVHVIYGALLHSGGQLSGLLSYFIADGSPLLNSFGLGNWTGLAATLVVVGLLTISSDLALRTLKAGPWKWLQRLNYFLFALVVAHAIFYGALLRATSPFTILLVGGVIAVFAGQAMGIWLWRRSAHRTARAA